MTSLIARLRERIQNPKLATSFNIYYPNTKPHYPPTTIHMVKAAEDKLGFHLPAFLREIYTQIGNGGFGPGHGGLFGLKDGAPAYDGHGNKYDLVDYYYFCRGQQDIHELHHDFENNGSLFSTGWFDKLVPICDWACDHYSCIDCSKPEMPVLFYIGYGGEFVLHSRTFDEWIKDWINGVDLWNKVMGNAKAG
jgi:hypothetical protein